MAASNLTNKLKVFAENTVNKQTDTEFTNEDQRDLGYAPNTVISSKVMNTALRQATLVSVALIDALKQLSVGDLVDSITFGSNTSVSDAKDAIVDAINKIKIPEATLADNVQPGTIVSDSMTSRKYKHGWQISQDLKKKMVFKETWVGTHMNNDVVYYNTGILKGYYIVHGLANESVNEGNGAVTEAGKLTITAGQTPATGAISGNLKRLTFETELGSDTALSKVTSISGSSTDNQIPSAKSVWNALEDVEGGMDAHSGRTDNPHAVTKAQVGLSNVTNDKQLKDSDKVTVISSSSTDTGIPSAKAAYTAINTVATNLSVHAGKKDNPHAVTKAQVGLMNVTNDKQLKDSDKVTSISSSSTDTNIPSAKAVYQLILNGVQNTLGNHMNDDNNPHGVTKTQISLENVTNHKQLKESDRVSTLYGEVQSNDIPTAQAVKNYVAQPELNIIDSGMIYHSNTELKDHVFDDPHDTGTTVDDKHYYVFYNLPNLSNRELFEEGIYAVVISVSTQYSPGDEQFNKATVLVPTFASSKRYLAMAALNNNNEIQIADNYMMVLSETQSKYKYIAYDIIKIA